MNLAASPLQKHPMQKKRPVYENASSLAEESRFKQAFEDRFPQMEIRKMPRHYFLDFAVFDKRNQTVVSLIEYKQRRYTSEQLHRFGGLSISMNKVKHGLEYAQKFGVPVCFFFRLNDCAEGEYFRFNVTPENVQQCKISYIDNKTKKPMRDWEDLEPCVQIPILLMSRKKL